MEVEYGASLSQREASDFYSPVTNARALDCARRLSVFLEELPNDLVLPFFQKYVEFNRWFAPFGLSFVSAVCRSTDVLGEEGCSRIARLILDALVDEFGLGEPDAISHRQLALSFLDALGAEMSNAPLHGDPEQEFRTLCELKISEGYLSSPNGLLNCDQVALGLGFHQAVEMNGVVEFRTIDRIMKRRWPSVVLTLNKRPNPMTVEPYRWISIHTRVEEQHFRSALQAQTIARELLTKAELGVERFDESYELGIEKFYTLFYQVLEMTQLGRN